MILKFFILFFFVFDLHSAPCAKTDLGIAYSICKEGVRNIKFYWKNECQTGGSAERLPATQTNVSCDKSCNFNEYYDVDTHNCTRCENGKYPADAQLTYGVINSTVFNRDFESRGLGGPWGVNSDGVITTGRQGPSADINLTLKDVDIVASAGNVTFSFVGFPNNRENRTTSLQFYVDGELRSGFLAFDTSWHMETFNLSFGVHNLTWRYTSTADAGINMVENVFIRFIVVTGTRYLPLFCKPCPPGTYDNESTPLCQACGFNSYSNSENSTSCTACPQNQYALGGSTECSPRVNCVSDTDFVPHYGPCVNGKTSVTFMKLEPSTCNSTGPSNRTEDCEACNPGEYKSSTTGNCIPCPSGQYRGANATSDAECQPCPAETAAFRSTYVRHLDFVAGANNTGVAGNFTVRCQSNAYGFDYCGDMPFWESHGNYIHTGSYSGPVRSTLTLSFTSNPGSRIEFSFTPHLHTESSFIYTNGPYLSLVDSRDNGVQKNESLVTDNQGSFSWTFFKRGPGFLANGSRIHDYVEIHFIALHGVNNPTSGASGCVICPSGTESPAGSEICSSCPVGLYSANGSACMPCEGNSIADRNGTSVCEPCGTGSVAVDSNTRCEIQQGQCGFTFNDTFTFDLSGLTTPDHPLTTLIAPQTNTRHFYSVCNYNTSSYCRSNNTNDTGTNALACEVSLTGSSRSWVVGNKTNFAYFENETSGDYGVNITYYNTLYGSGDDSNAGRDQTSAEVLLLCVPNSGFGMIFPCADFQNVTANPGRYHFIWESEYGCRLCSPNDYDTFTSECVKPGTRTVSLVLRNSTRCSHGFVAPPPYTEKCKRAAVHMSGGALAGIIIAGLVVLAAIIAGLVFLIYKNRALTHQLVQGEKISLGGAQGGQGAEGMVSFGTRGGTTMFKNKE